MIFIEFDRLGQIYIFLVPLHPKYQRLVSMLLCPQRPSHIFRAFHNTSALIVQAKDRGHHVSAGGGF